METERLAVATRQGDETKVTGKRLLVTTFEDLASVFMIMEKQQQEAVSRSIQCLQDIHAEAQI